MYHSYAAIQDIEGFHQILSKIIAHPAFEIISVKDKYTQHDTLKLTSSKCDKCLFACEFNKTIIRTEFIWPPRDCTWSNPCDRALEKLFSKTLDEINSEHSYTIPYYDVWKRFKNVPQIPLARLIKVIEMTFG